MPVKANVDRIERFEDEPHLAEADMKCLSRKVNIVLRVTGAHECKCCAIRRLDAERRASYVMRNWPLPSAVVSVFVYSRYCVFG